MDALSSRDGGIYVDGTFGAGGYTRAILDSCDCQVWAIDRDPDAISRANALAAGWMEQAGMRAHTDEAGNISLNIEATEKTWIEVSADGKRIFAGILEPGQTKTISSAQRTKMVVGNAAGIAVRKGGRDIGPIGPRGQVRTLNITADSVEIVPPAPKTAI